MSTQPVPMHSQEARESSNNSPSASARYICFGTYHLDLKKEELFNDGARVKLQGKVYQALVTLLQKSGGIETREELRLQLWPDALVNYDANVNTTVNKLRQVLGDSPDQPAFVDTIPRKGYSFVGQVRYVDQPVAQLSPKVAELSAIAMDQQRAESKLSFFRTAILSKWFTAAV